MKNLMSKKDNFKVALIFWAVTFPAMFYFGPALILAVLNPFWFREDALVGLQTQVEKFGNWRSTKLEPIYRKYKAFQMLQKSNDENSGMVAAKTEAAKLQPWGKK